MFYFIQVVFQLFIIILFGEDSVCFKLYDVFIKLYNINIITGDDKENYKGKM